MTKHVSKADLLSLQREYYSWTSRMKITWLSTRERFVLHCASFALGK